MVEVNGQFNIPYLIVFIPAYNEEKTIQKVISAVNNSFKEYESPNFYVDIFVIDDGSTDNTVSIAKESGARVIRHLKNMGLGAATRTGMQRAYELGADLAVKIDADAQFDPSEIKKLITPLFEERADCVFGSRFVKGSQYRTELRRSWGNRIFAWLISFLTGLKITDSATGFMAFNKSYLSRFSLLESYNETQQLILDSWGKNMRIMEIAVSTIPRKEGRSFVSWRYPFIVLPAMLRTYIHVKPLRSFFYIGLFVLLLGTLIGILWFFGVSKFFGDATAAILIIVGVQIILFGFLADIISKKR